MCFTHGLALLSHYFKSTTCVYAVMFSFQRRCMDVLCCYFRPKMFSPGDCVRYHSRTLRALGVLATVVGLSRNGPQFCHIRHIHPGGVTPVDDESAQLSRLEAVAVPQFALKYPCNPPPPPGRPSLGDRLPPPKPRTPPRANVGDCKGVGVHWCTNLKAVLLLSCGLCCFAMLPDSW